MQTYPTNKADFDREFTERFTGKDSAQAVYDWAAATYSQNWPTNTPSDADDFEFMAAVTDAKSRMDRWVNPRVAAPSGRTGAKTQRGRGGSAHSAVRNR